MKPISIPSRPRTIKNRQHYLDPLQHENIIKNDQPLTVDSIDTFLSTELAKARSDSDKMFVYQKSFDFLLNQFKICRPLLSRIKKQYDMISADLISKRRELSMNNASVSSSEEIFSDAINELRKVRTQEFAQKKSKKEQLLDQMTELRMKRSELLQQFNNLTKKDNDLSKIDSNNTNKIIEMNSKINDINDLIKSTNNSSLLKKKEIDELLDEISKTQQSKDELAEKDQYFISQIILHENEKNELESRISNCQNKNSELSKEITDLQNKIETLNKKKNDAISKLHFVEVGYRSNEEKLRDLLRETNSDIDPNLPIDELLAKIQEIYV